MLKLMSSSRNPADRKLFLEYAYGKPKEEVDVTSGGEKLKGNNDELRTEILGKLDSIAIARNAPSDRTHSVGSL